MKPVRIHPEATQEMIEAALWYEAQQVNLGKRFLTSVQDGRNRIELNPRLFATIEGDVRRCLTRTFPFGLLFRDRADHIEIVAIMNLNRAPGYWKNR